MKDRFISRRFIAFGTALLLGLLLVSSLLVGMALAQESQPDRLDVEAATGVSYWLILDTARPVEETLPPLLKILDTLKASGAIVEFDSTPQRSAPTAAAGVRVVVARPERLDLLRTLPGVLDAVVTLPPPPPQLGDLGILATTGEITGRVTDMNSSPLNGLPVYAYDAVSFAFIGNDNTDISGEYTITGTAHYNQAKIVFFGNDVYAREWYNNQPFFSVATPIDLPRSNIDAALEHTGTISGAVTDQEGRPAQSLSIAIYKSDGSFIDKFGTNENGLFTAIVPSGTYKLELVEDRDEYLKEWYQDKNSLVNATPITVTAGQTTPLTAQVSRTGAISGVITNSVTGDGLYYIEVTVYDTAGKEVKSDTSDSWGNYRVRGLLSGNYRLRFKSDLLSYETEYYNDKPTLAAASAVSVTFGATTGNIDAALIPATGQITGTITKNSGVPLAVGETLDMFLYDAASGDLLSILPSFFIGDESTTTYNVTVASGTYKIYFSPSSYNLTGEWYNNKTSKHNADPVDVTNGATTPNINADLTVMTSTAYGCISGAVTTGGGAPLEDAEVGVYEVGADYWYLNPVITNSDGNYLICRLNPGIYQVSFSYYPSATTWYNGKTSRATATAITVTSGMTTPGVSGSLDQLGGCIKGKITDLGGNALPYAKFQIFEPGGKVIPVYYGQNDRYLKNVSRVDNDGGFVACGLQPGVYTIAMYNNDGGEQGSVTANVTAGQQTDVGVVRIGLYIYLPIIVRN